MTDYLRGWYQFSIRLIALTVLGIGGCGDNPKTSPTAPAATLDPAVVKCKALQDEYCPRLEYCTGLQGGNRKASDCKASLDRDHPCSQYTTVPAGYDKCLSDIKGSTCADISQLSNWGAPYPTEPGSCEGVLDLSSLGVVGSL
jgi:hypothetical protein